MTDCPAVVAVLLLAVLLGGCAAPPPIGDGSLAPCAWLTGTWVSHPEEPGPSTVEQWLPPAGGTMLGMNRTVLDDGRVAFEFMRIAPDKDGTVTLFAQPGGISPATPFALTGIVAGRMMLFENRAHDFPQRIIYEAEGRAGLTMMIEGSGDDGPRSVRWRMVRPQ